MSPESIVLPFIEAKALADHGIMPLVAMEWAIIKDCNGILRLAVISCDDAMAGCIGADDDGQKVLCGAPVMSELLDEIDPEADSTGKMVALAHALIALHEEVAG